eukprot:scaffold2.g7095.t1
MARQRPAGRTERAKRSSWCRATGEAAVAPAGDARPAPVPLYGGFVKRRPDAGQPAAARVAPCRRCGGGRAVPCEVCGGSGRLGRGGYQKRNPLNLSRLVEEERGQPDVCAAGGHLRRSDAGEHRQLSPMHPPPPAVAAAPAQRRRKQRVEPLPPHLVAQGASNARARAPVWINAQNLRDRQRWAAGWLQKQDILALEQQQQQQQQQESSVLGAEQLEQRQQQSSVLGAGQLEQQQQSSVLGAGQLVQQQQQQGATPEAEGAEAQEGEGSPQGRPPRRVRRRERRGATTAALAGAGAECRTCAGTGLVPCPLCSRGGQVIEL